jgi:hypothetical protein
MERHPNDLTTDEEIDEALALAKLCPPETTIVDFVFHAEPDLDLFVLKLSDGKRIVLPREELSELKGATLEQASDFFIGPNRVDIWWPQVDDGIYLPNLLEERYGSLRREIAA